MNAGHNSIVASQSKERVLGYAFMIGPKFVSMTITSQLPDSASYIGIVQRMMAAYISKFSSCRHCRMNARQCTDIEIDGKVNRLFR